MNLSSIPLRSTSNRITGSLAGRPISCFFHPVSGGLPPGNYKISGPMRNSVYGTFALLTAAGPAPGAAVQPGALAGKDWISAGWIEKGWIEKGWMNAGWVNRDWIESGWVSPPGQINQPGVFVVMDKPLAGRNGIVVTSGFAELMAALQQAGGATVTVS